MPDIQNAFKKIAQAIDSDEEKSRRAYSERTHKIFRDGGKEYLIEALRAEFDEDTVKEFRLAPINLLKTIVNKKSKIYKTPPKRSTEMESDQVLIDFYTEELSFNEMMGKANRYFNLHSNCAPYIFPDRDNKLSMKVVPPHLYSIVPDEFDRTRVKVWAFNNFKERSEIINDQDLPAATGRTGFARTRFKSSPDIVATQSLIGGQPRQIIFWSDTFHATTDESGNILVMDPSKGEEQFLNPIEMSPVVHLQKDTDNEAWSVQGQDSPDLALLVQRMWTDLATIIKHQGFGQMVVTSEEQPTKMTLGMNKALWLKVFPGKDRVPPRVDFLTAESRIGEIKESIRELIFLLLTTNDINPSSAGKADGGAAFTSGIQALLEMSDALEAMRNDQPVFRDAEKDLWEVIKRWHNWMFDLNILSQDAKNLGKFSEDFRLSVDFAELKPLETESDRMDLAEKGKNLGVMSKKDMLRKVNPDMTDEEADAKLEEIKQEREEMVQAFNPTPFAPEPINTTKM